MTIEQVLEQAREGARRDGRPRYVSVVADPPWCEAILVVEDREPAGEHVRIAPDGSAAIVYPPG